GRYALAGALGALMIGAAAGAYVYLHAGPQGGFPLPSSGAAKPLDSSNEQKIAQPSDPPGPALTPPKQAMLPQANKQSAAPGTAALAPPNSSKAAQIERYVVQYDGGDCVFVSPSAIGANAVRLDGYGADESVFHVLDEAFKRANGFEADIDVRQVT